MPENRPAWQTDDLLEEWIEPVSPPSGSPSYRTPEPVKQSTVNGSIRWPGTARKASLRSEAIGGPSRQLSGPSANGRQAMRIVSGNVQNSIGSLLAPSPAPNQNAEQSLHSPPASMKSSSSQEEEDQQGTFLIRPLQAGSQSGSQKPQQGAGIGIGKPKQLRNPFIGGGGGFGGAGLGGGIFDKTKLEKMFEPPTPPRAAEKEQQPVQEEEQREALLVETTTSVTTIQSTISTAQSTSSTSAPLDACPSPPAQTPELRRTSHSYVPRRPSRLSHSLSPKELAGDSTEGSIAADTVESGADGALDASDAGALEKEEAEDERDEDQEEVLSGDDAQEQDKLERSYDAEDEQDEAVDLSPANRFSHQAQNASFTFSPPPSLPKDIAASQRDSKPKLKLFQTYDTYTKDHLNKIVEVISSRGTPVPLSKRARGRLSQGSRNGGQRSERWSVGSAGNGGMAADGSSDADNESGSGTPSGSGEQSASGSGGSSSWGEDDQRASKRIRLSASYSPEPRSGSSHGGSFGPQSDSRSYQEASQPDDPSSLSLRPRKTHLPLGQGMPTQQYQQAIDSAAKDENRRSWGDKGQDMLRRIRERVGLVDALDMSVSGGGSVSGSGGSGSSASSSPNSGSSSSFSSGPNPAMAAVVANLPVNLASQPARQSTLVPSSSAYSTLRSESTNAGNGSGSGSGGTITSQYLEAGRGMLGRIKERTVSDSSGSGNGGDKGKARATEETKLAPKVPVRGETGGLVDQEPRKIRSLPSHSGSTTTASSVTVRPPSAIAGPSKLVPAERIAPGYLLAQSRPSSVPQDLNRYVSSASTITAGTTTTAMSTSFVKHRGSTAPSSLTSGQRGKEFIPLEMVRETLSDHVGAMRFDRDAMRWVPSGEGRQGDAGEEEDIFQGMESLREDGEAQEDTEGDDAESEADDDSAVDASIGHELQQHVDDADLAALSQSNQAELLEDDSENGALGEGLTEGSNEDTIRQDTEAGTTQLDSRSLSVLPSTSMDAKRTPSPPERRQPVEDYRFPPHRPELHATKSAPTPLLPSRGGEELRRSILRNNTAPPSVLKKSHPLTPVQDSSLSSSRRNVSFSDGKKAGKIRDIASKSNKVSKLAQMAHGGISQEERDFFEGQDETKSGSQGATRKFLPSARSGRIADLAHVLDEEESDESEPSATPSKPQSHARHSKTLSLSDNDTLEGNSTLKASRLNHSVGYGRGNIEDTRLTDWPFEVAHDHLVELITEVQPFEPHWEMLTQIDLSGRGATSVARLKEFLPKLDEAILNNNQITFLTGIPKSVRSLHVSRNRLSSLTSVSHLYNLQYLDISRNELDSINQLACLKHLRELNVDHNKIKDLSDIMDMNFLQKLSCANNAVTSVNFSQAKWSRLETLNISQNRIASVTGLERLTALTSLNLDSNRITELSVPKEMTHLRVLRFSQNNVREINLSSFPRLRTLYADNNSLDALRRSNRHVGGKLEYLSLRNQKVPSLLLTHDDLKDVRYLYISGNPLAPDFFPEKPMFSMVYLEAAACKLSRWPESFVARLPNIRILNLNYNFFENLDGLQGLTGLRKLMMVGGRLGDVGAKGVVRGLRGLRTIEEVDLRMNPCTLNFYLPLMLPGGSASSALDPSAAPPLDVSSAQLAPADAWVQLDANFRRSLPDEWYRRRLYYRGLVMMACEGVVAIDGIRVSQGERKKTMVVVDHMLDNEQS